MLGKLNDLPTDQGFAPGSKMFVFQEVIDQGGEPIKVNEYYNTGKEHVRLPFLKVINTFFFLNEIRLRNRVSLLFTNRCWYSKLQ